MSGVGCRRLEEGVVSVNSIELMPSGPHVVSGHWFIEKVLGGWMVKKLRNDMFTSKLLIRKFHKM